VLIRLLFVVTAFISGVGILAYLVLWIVVPFEGDPSSRMDALRRDFDDLSGRVREYVDPSGAGQPHTPGSSAAAWAAAGPAASAPGAPPRPTAHSTTDPTVDPVATSELNI